MPADERAVCRLVLATTEIQREATLTVLREFWDLTDEGWTNRRALAEIEGMRDKQQKQRDKANRRWDKQRAEHGIASALPQHQSDDATASKNDADALPPTPTPTPTPNKDIGAEAPLTTRKRKLPEDFEPNERGVTAARDAGLDLTQELQVFRDHHQAQGSVMADWQAAWRTWVTKAVQYGRGGKKVVSPSKPAWAIAAGFDTFYEAHNAGCYEHNASQFRNGQRIGEAR